MNDMIAHAKKKGITPEIVNQINGILSACMLGQSQQVKAWENPSTFPDLDEETQIPKIYEYLRNVAYALTGGWDEHAFDADYDPALFMHRIEDRVGLETKPDIQNFRIRVLVSYASLKLRNESYSHHKCLEKLVNAIQEKYPVQQTEEKESSDEQD